MIEIVLIAFNIFVQTINWLYHYNISYMLFGSRPPQPRFEWIIRTNLPKIVVKQYINIYLLRMYVEVIDIPN